MELRDRLAVWDRNNRVTREAGGPDCLWIGMNGGSVTGQSRSFRDNVAICSRAQILMLDHQSRGDSDSFQNNAETGKLLHGLLGLGQVDPRKHAHVPDGPAHLPALHQAGTRGPDVDAGRVRGRNPALVAPRGGLP